MKNSVELPGTKVRKVNLVRRFCPCPRCGRLSDRHSTCVRRLREVGFVGPTVLEVTYTKHRCNSCKTYFSVPMDHLARPYSQFTHRVRHNSVALVVRDGLTQTAAARFVREKYHVRVPVTTLSDWMADELEKNPFLYATFHEEAEL